MAIPTTIESLSTTAASNGPSGSDQRTLADDGLRQAYAFIKQLVVQGSDIASAGTITPPSTASLFDITGTTTITTIASTNSWDGRVIYLQFDGALTLTHNGTTLILPGATNITTVAGDIAVFVQRGSGAWQCVNYLRKDGSSPGVGSFTTLNVSGDTTLGDATTDASTINGSLTINGPTSASTPLIVSASVAGGTITTRVSNTDNTNTASNARFLALSGGSSGGDPITEYQVSGIQSWAVGVDNSASDTFKIDASSGLGTATNWLNITTDGRIYGTALHNNAGAVTGTTNQYIARSFNDNTTITATAGSNVSSTGTVTGHWVRDGNFVYGVLNCANIDPTSASTATTFTLNAPITGMPAGTTACSGTAVRVQTGSLNCIVGSVTGGGANTIQVSFLNDTDTAARDWVVTFGYTITS